MANQTVNVHTIPSSAGDEVVATTQVRERVIPASQGHVVEQ